MAEETTTEPGSEEKKVTKEEVEARLAGKEPPKGEEPAKEEPKVESKKEPEKNEELEQILAQADKPDAVKNAILRHQTAAREARERAEAAEVKVQEYVDRDKTEEQKRAEKAEVDRKRAEEAEAKLERVEVAIAAKLPLELAERLRGSNKQELTADAMRLLELVKPNAPTGDPDAGKGEAKSDEEDFTATLRKKAGITT